MVIGVFFMGQERNGLQIKQKAGIIRWITIFHLFAGIFWSFYSLRYRALWHKAGWQEEKKAELYVSQAVYFRETAVELGGLLIKLGQFLSTRADMLPSTSTDELAKLQDGVREVAFSELRTLAEMELARPLEQVFAYVEEKPIAAASLGQVHRVVLKSGETAALKIQRPGIDKLIAIDLQALKRVIAFMKRFTDWEKFVDFDAIFRDFSTTVAAELDYIQEAQNADTLRQNCSTEPDIIIPKIYWEYTTARVLTMEFVQGIKITDVQAIKEAGIDPVHISSRLLQIYIKQILIDGFFHADPHPGNLSVDRDSRIIMVDFGLVGEIDPDLRQILVQMVYALVSRDFEKVIVYLKIVGFLNSSVNDQALIRALSIFLEQLLGKASNLAHADLNIFLSDFEQLLYEQPFQLPAKFNFLGRALGTLYGICVRLNPEISFIDEAKPFVDRLSPAADNLWKLVKDKTLKISTALLDIPVDMTRILNKADRGDLKLAVTSKQFSEEVKAQTDALRSLSYLMVFAVAFIGGTYLLVNQYHLGSHACHALSFLFFLLFLRNLNMRPKRKITRYPQTIPRRHI